MFISTIIYVAILETGFTKKAHVPLSKTYSCITNYFCSIQSEIQKYVLCIHLLVVVSSCHQDLVFTRGCLHCPAGKLVAGVGQSACLDIKGLFHPCNHIEIIFFAYLKSSTVLPLSMSKRYALSVSAELPAMKTTPKSVRAATSYHGLPFLMFFTIPGCPGTSRTQATSAM